MVSVALKLATSWHCTATWIVLTSYDCGKQLNKVSLEQPRGLNAAERNRLTAAFSLKNMASAQLMSTPKIVALPAFASNHHELAIRPTRAGQKDPPVKTRFASDERTIVETAPCTHLPTQSHHHTIRSAQGSMNHDANGSHEGSCVTSPSFTTPRMRSSVVFRPASSSAEMSRPVSQS
jgi:hypothetical protein